MTGLLADRFRDLPVTGGRTLPDLRDGLPAGDVAGLASALRALELSDASDVDLLAAAVGWDRLEAMAAAGKARALSDLAARTGVGPERMVDEWQAATSCTMSLAQRAVGRALHLATQPALAGALAHGDLDLRRVDAVLDALPLGGDPRRWAGVIDVVLDEAPLLSAPALKKRTERLVMAAEPSAATARCARARADRAVTLKHVGDSMSLLSAYLPAEHAVAAFTVVDALAGTHRAAGDERTVDQRRADAFAGLFTDILTTGTVPDGTALPRRQRRRAEIQVTVAATTLLGLDELPGELAGHGPIPADLARAIARDGTWRRLLTDPTTGALLDRGTVTYPPGVVPSPGAFGPGADCGAFGPAADSSAFGPAADSSALRPGAGTGADASPTGIGPGAFGPGAGLSTDAYRPAADLAAFVAARDVTCTYMGCGQPACRCELDHRVSFDPSRPAAAQTTADNLDVRCHHHHDLKGSGGWSVRRIPTSGACEWTDPWGITYTRLAIPIVLTAAILERLPGRARSPGHVGTPGSPGTPGTAGTAGTPGSPGSPRTLGTPGAGHLAGPISDGGYPDEPPF